jgi:NADP-dependent 3-hydroxy acid dehydrogenase YdfG
VVGALLARGIEFRAMPGSRFRDGEATAREFARRSGSLFLVGRNAGRLAIADALELRGVATQVHDARDGPGYDALLQAATQALGGRDTALIAHGALADEAACQQSVPQMLDEFNINAARHDMHAAGQSLRGRRSRTLIELGVRFGRRPRARAASRARSSAAARSCTHWFWWAIMTIIRAIPERIFVIAQTVIPPRRWGNP